MSNAAVSGSDKLYLLSGQFTTTVKDSESATGTYGVSTDTNNTQWNSLSKLYLLSGQFTSTIKDSVSGASFDSSVRDISSDGTNTPTMGNSTDKLFLLSGQFTSTLKDSESISAYTSLPGGISWDGTNTPFCGELGGKLWLISGQFTSTIKDSVTTPSPRVFVPGVSFDGTDTPWANRSPYDLVLFSGQFTSTVKVSLDISSVEGNTQGFEHDPFSERVAAPPATTGDAEGVATTTGIAAAIFRVAGSAEGVATTSGVAGDFIEVDGAAVGNATTSGEVVVITSASGNSQGTATTSGDVRVVVRASGSIQGTATCNAEARLTKVSVAVGRAYANGLLSVTAIAVNPPLAGDLVDIGNNGVFQLTVNGDLLDFSTVTSCYYAYSMRSLEVSYDGKNLEFEQFTGIGSASYAPEQSVTLDIDFGDGISRRLFTGKIKQREHVGINNRESVIYRASDYLQLADDLTIVNSDGFPRIQFTAPTSVTSVSSSFGTFVGSFYANGSVPISEEVPKKIRTAVTELFSFNATQLSSAGIPTAIGAPGLEQFTAELPETVTLEGIGFGTALKRLAQYQNGVKVLFDEQQQAWVFPNLQTCPTVTVDISSTNIPELPFTVDTSDRFTAVRLYADIDQSLDNVFQDRTSVVSLGGPLGFGEVTRKEVTLQPMWLREREARWSMFKALYSDPSRIDGEDYFVYRRYALPEGTRKPAFGLVARVFAKYNYWGEETWAPLSGAVLFRRGIFMAAYPAISTGNPWHPGSAFPAQEVKMAYLPGNVDYTPASSITDSGSIIFGGTATTIDQSEFADQLRYPATGWEGTAFTQFGIEREFHQIVGRTEVTEEKAKAILDVRKDAVVEGDIPIEGDPILQLMTLGVKVAVTHPTKTTGIESLTPFVTQYSYTFGKRGESNVSLTTDIAGLLR